MALLPKRKKASKEQGRKKDKYIQGAKKKAGRTRGSKFKSWKQE